jgi:hypothetical protein
MNYKKILLISIFLLAVISSFSVVSAGWFDFGSSVEDLNLTIDDSDLTVNVELGDHELDAIGGVTMVENGFVGAYIIDGTPNKYFIDGKISFDLSSLSADEMNAVKESTGISNMTFNVGDIKYQTVDNLKDFTVDNDKLTINFDNVEFTVDGFDANVEKYDLKASDIDFDLDKSGGDSPDSESSIHVHGSK